MISFKVISSLNMYASSAYIDVLKNASPELHIEGKGIDINHRTR